MRRTLVWILVGLLLVSHVAAKESETEKSGKEAEREKEDSTEREHRQVSRRSLEINVDDYEVEVEGKVKEGKVKDSVKFVLKTKEDDGMRIRFEHRAKQEDQSASNLRFLVNVQEVIEYLPATAGAEFQPDATGNSTTSQVLRRWKLRKTDWGKFTQTKTAAGVHQFTATAGNGVLVVRGSLAEADLSAATAAGTPAVALDANSMKVDIEVHNWQWSTSTTGSRLALRAAVKSVRTEGHDKDAKDAVAAAQVKFAEAAGGQPGGRFRWADTVSADGVTANVKSFILARASSESEDGEGYRSWNDMYFSFLTAGQSKDIIWDPQVGLDYSTLAGPNTGMIIGLVVGGIALVALVAIVAVVVVRRRRAAGPGQEELAYRAA